MVFHYGWKMKDGLPKKKTLKYDIFFMIGKYDVSFSCKYDLLIVQAVKDDLPTKKYTETFPEFCLQILCFSKKYVAL